MSKIYLITEAANEVEVENHVLRYWEEELSLPVHRNELGHRYYTEDDVKLFQKIKYMKEQGLQLKAIKLVLKGMNIWPVEENEKTQSELFEENEEENDYENTEEKADKGKNEIMTENKEKNIKRNVIETWEMNGKRKSNEKEKNARIENQSEKTINIGENGTDNEKVEDEYDRQIKNKNKVIRECEKDKMEADRLEKAKKLRMIIQMIVKETMEEYMESCSMNIKDIIAKEMDYQFRMWQEQLDENNKEYRMKKKLF